MKKIENKFENGWALNLQKNHGQKALDKVGLKQFKKNPDDFNYGKYIMPEELLREYADEIYWYGVVETQNLTECFIREMSKRFKKRVEWYGISKHFYNFTDAFLKDFAKKLDWTIISHKLTEKQIEKFVDYVDWSDISHWKKLSKEFAKKHFKDIHWTDYYMHNVDFCFQGCWHPGDVDYIDKAAKKYKGMFN